MKIIISVIITLSLIFTLCSCTKAQEKPTGSSSSSSPAGTEKNEGSAEEKLSGKKILTIYFSSANTSGADVVSSATPFSGGKASTELLAAFIHEKVGGDIDKITPQKDYPEDYKGTADAAKAERDSDKRPAYKALSVNPEDYDVIFVGYPMWWYTLPMIMYTFFDDYDFSGKTIVPFNTHAGSGDGGTYAEIAEFEPNAKVLDGLAVSGTQVGDSEENVENWLNGLSY